MPDLVSAAAEAANASYLSCGSVTSTGRGVQLRVASRTASATGAATGTTGTTSGNRCNVAPRIGSSRVTSVRRLPGISVTTRAVGSIPCLVRSRAASPLIGAALQYRVADERRRQAVAGEECRLEWQQAEQLIP